MIKKFLIGLISCLFIMPAMANVNLTVDAVRQVVPLHISSAKQAPVVQAIIDKMNASNGAGISSQDLVGICSVAGWKINKSDDYNKCVNFVDALLNKSTVNFYHVCDEKVQLKNGGGRKCLEDFKTNTIKVQVDSRSAPYLAKYLILNKVPDEKRVVCAKEIKNWRTHKNDDFIPCTSLARNYFYEVRFDDAKETKDNTRRNGVVTAVCDVFHNVHYTPAGCVSGGTVNVQTCWDATCATSDANLCSKINNDLNYFGFSANLSDKSCKISFDIIRKKDLKHPFGLDSFAFCRDIQIATNASLDAQIEAYVRNNANTTVTSFYCDKSDVPYLDGGCTSKIGNIRDDLVKCYVNGQEVDFIFDDLSESRKRISQGGWQGLSCIASDGSFDGKACIGVNEKGCQEVKKLSASICPECKDVAWNAERGLCELPSSKSATNLQKGLEVAGFAGVVVGAVALTVFSGGTASGVWVVVGNVGTALTIGGGTAVVSSKVVTTYLVYTPAFQSELNRCLNANDVQCAKDMLKTNLQKMVSYEKNLTDAEKKTLDESFAKLFKKIPADDDEFWGWLDDPKVWSCNSRGDCVVKEKAQFWQSVRTVGDVAMILGGALKAFAQIASSMTRTTDVIRGVGETRRVKIVDNMKGSPKLKNLSPEGVTTTLTSNNFVQNVTVNGMRFTKNSELAAYLLSQGYKVGDVVQLASGVGTSMVLATIMSASEIAFNLGGLTSVVVGTGDLITSGEGIPFVVHNPNVQKDDVPEPEVAPKTPELAPIDAPGLTPTEIPVVEKDLQLRPRQNNVVPETPLGAPESDLVPEAAPEVVPDAVPDVVPEAPSSYQEPENVPVQNTKKSDLSGLKAAAIGAGVAGLGVGAALLIGGAKDKSAASGATVSGGNIDIFNNIKARSNGILGYVENSAMELIPIETTTSAKENIVSINEHAVVVVRYKGNLIPFMVDTENGVTKWVPFVSVDVNTRAFRKYTSKTDILRTAKIAEKLSEVFPPLQMQYFASPNQDGVQFASPSINGYQLINNNSLRHLSFNINKNTRSGVFL